MQAICGKTILQRFILIIIIVVIFIFIIDFIIVVAAYPNPARLVALSVHSIQQKEKDSSSKNVHFLATASNSLLLFNRGGPESLGRHGCMRSTPNGMPGYCSKACEDAMQAASCNCISCLPRFSLTLKRQMERCAFELSGLEEPFNAVQQANNCLLMPCWGEDKMKSGANWHRFGFEHLSIDVMTDTPLPEKKWKHEVVGMTEQPKEFIASLVLD
eukprot:4561497-Amphidinium_carterae.1